MSSKPAEYYVLKSHSKKITHYRDTNKVLLVSKRNVTHLIDMPKSIMDAVAALKDIRAKDLALPAKASTVNRSRPASQIQMQF